MRPSKAAAARLRRVRALLARRGGWVKKVSILIRKDSTAAYCLGYAIVVANGPGIDHDRVSAVIKTMYPDSNGSIISFNDSPKTKKADVLAVLDRAIMDAEE